ncbi:MAG: UvrD-helicase domain-containing protein [Anaerolineales bacterium]|nr:UvrD-helicase domain-containing protein [Anaerolineales bacterium]
MDLLAGLNPQQQQALTAGPGPVLVLAGPGSGKTRVLTHRIAYLVSQLGVRPYNILAVTFTNKAAREMEARVEGLIGEVRGLMLGTFHSTCARILRREAQHLPFESNFVIFDSDDQVTLVRQICKELNLDDKTYRPHSIHNRISGAKNELILPEDFPILTYRDEIIQRVYQRYQALLLNSNALDFDDLLLYTANLLDANIEVRQTYARRFEQILVDEFQDTNMAQYRLLMHLASFHKNIFVVGDVDQSIYRWRGADYRNVLRFENDYPDSVVILLEQNYRSTQNILDAAMAVIEPNPNRTHKNLFTEQRGTGNKIVLTECFDGREEGKFIVEKIALSVAQEGREPGEFAVMYRTNAQSRLIEEAFIMNNLPYKLVGAQRFYGRREIKDVVAYLRLVHNPLDEVSLLRVINTPRRKIGGKTLADLHRRATQTGQAQTDILLDLAQHDAESAHTHAFTPAAGRSLTAFGALLAGWLDAAQDLSPMELMDLILEDIQYQDYLDDGTDEGVDRWENVLELRRVAAEYEQRDLGEFLEQLALVSDQDTIDETENVPTLLTLHAAKGLEFPVVFIAGLEDGTLPHQRSFDEPESMAEERRLFYVGITRAKDQLYLVHAENRMTYGYSEPTEPSRFLDDIPAELIDGLGHVRAGRPSRSVRQQYSWDAAASSSAAIIQPQYKAGMNVRHPSWGEGMVLNTHIDGGDEIVDIFFQDIGLKKVVAALAHLEIMDG